MVTPIPTMRLINDIFVSIKKSKTKRFFNDSTLFFFYYCLYPKLADIIYTVARFPFTCLTNLIQNGVFHLVYV